MSVTARRGATGASGGSVVNINTLTSAQMVALNMTGTITSVTMGAQPVVRFSVVDQNGRGVTGLAVASASNAANTAYTKLVIAKLDTDPTDTNTNAWSNYLLDSSTQSLPTSTGLVANIVDNGDGTYQYTFANSNFTVDSTKTHRVAVQISGNVPNVTPTLPITHPVNIIYTFVPNGGAVTTRDIVSETACNGCHTKLGNTALDITNVSFKPGQPGHGGRQVTKYCVMCHNPQMESTGRPVSAATATGLLTNAGGSTWLLSNGTATYAQMEFVTMIHKTHMGADLNLQGYDINNGHYKPNAIGYPQDIRNCTTCHVGPDADNWKTKPSMKACGSCHDNISFAAVVPTGFVAHAGGPQTTNANCTTCHPATGAISGVTAPIVASHNTGSTNTDQATGDSMVPTVAPLTYVISSATVSTNGEMSVVFKIQENGVDLQLGTFGTSSMLASYNTTSGPTFIEIYGVPQDGITTPSDWNSGHTSISLQNVWNGTKGTLSGPNGSGFYTALLSGATLSVPSNATMVTAMLKDSPTSNATGSVVIAGPAMKTATGYTARRVIVDVAKCNSCHKQLGTSPNFHSGNYSIAMCAACHTPNQSSNGWTASFRTWVHGIHGASKRSVKFTWHAVNNTGDDYSNLLYPAILNDCEKCHLSGTYDFSGAAYTSSVMNGMLNVLVAKATYTNTDSLAGFKNSPYVDLVSNYGAGPSVSNGGIVTAGSVSNLVQSPITAVCVACHDLTSDINHMKANGGQFYATRASAPAPAIESCLVCHGKGATVDIVTQHKVN